MRLPVVGHDDDRIPLQQGVHTPCHLGEGADGVVAAAQHLQRRVRAVGVRGVVVVGEIEKEEVERIARDEPAADGGRVGVDRAGGAVPPGERRARPVGAEEVVEEEPLRRRDGAEKRHRRAVARPSPVGGEVDGRGPEPGVGERLEDRHGPLAEMLAVHVDERVAQRVPDPGGTDGLERAPVLDDPPLVAVEPDEVRNLVHVAVGAGGDRGEADRSQRGEDRRRPPVLALGGEGGERRRVAGADRPFEHRRRQPVDENQDDGTRAHFASERRPSYLSGLRRARRAARAGSTTASM